PTLESAYPLQKRLAVWQGGGNFLLFLFPHLMGILQLGEKLPRILNLVDAEVQVVHTLIVNPKARVVARSIRAMSCQRKEWLGCRRPFGFFDRRFRNSFRFYFCSRSQRGNR